MYPTREDLWKASQPAGGVVGGVRQLWGLSDVRRRICAGRKGGSKLNWWNAGGYKDAGSRDDIIRAGSGRAGKGKCTSGRIRRFTHPHPACLPESLQQNSQHAGKGVAEALSTCLAPRELGVFLQTQGPVCFSAKWCNWAGSPGVSSCDITDQEKAELRPQDPVWEKESPGFLFGVSSLCLFHKRAFSLLFSDEMLTASFGTLFSQVDLMSKWNAS